MKKMALPNFIEKVWEILNCSQYENVLRWVNHGLSFEVCDQQAFSRDVLPRFFKHSNFSSFIRQLNMYNFHKKRNSNTHLEFYHKLFRRSHEELLIGIKRKPSQADLRYGDELIIKHNVQPAQSFLEDNRSIQDQHNTEDRQNTQNKQNTNPVKCQEVELKEKQMAQMNQITSAQLASINSMNSFRMSQMSHMSQISQMSQLSQMFPFEDLSSKPKVVPNIILVFPSFNHA